MGPDRAHIAIIVPGGIGTGPNNMGVPVLEHIVKLLSADFDIKVFSLFKVNAGYSAAGFEIISIPSTNFILRSLRLFFLFRKSHRKRRFICVHGFWALPSGLLAVILGKLFGIKSIVSVLGGDGSSVSEISYGELRRWLPRKLILWTLTHAKHGNVLTKFLEKNLACCGLERKLQVIPWGVDTDLFSFSDHDPAPPVRFLHIANFSEVKDQETLLRAFKIIRDTVDAKLTIIGTGPLRNRLNELAISLQISDRVEFVKPIRYEKLVTYYHHSDILLHTSLSEGQSEVVTEAMSTGVVVCGTDVGLIHDLKPLCCVSVPLKAHERLAEEVLKLISDKEMLHKLKSSAREWAEEHSIHWTVKKYGDLYKA